MNPVPAAQRELAEIDAVLNWLPQWWPIILWPSRHSDRPRVRATRGGGVPEAGDMDVVLGYRKCAQQIASAHLSVMALPGTLWRPQGLLGRPVELVRDTHPQTLRTALVALSRKLAAAADAEDFVTRRRVREASNCVHGAWLALPGLVADATRPGRVRYCRDGCGRLVGDRRGDQCQACANRASRHRRREQAPA